MRRRTFLALAGTTLAGLLTGCGLGSSHAPVPAQPTVEDARKALEEYYAREQVPESEGAITSIMHLYLARLRAPFMKGSTQGQRQQAIARTIGFAHLYMLQDEHGAYPLLTSMEHRGQVGKLLNFMVDEGLIDAKTPLRRDADGVYTLDDLAMGHARNLHERDAGTLDMLDDTVWNLINLRSLPRDTQVRMYDRERIVLGRHAEKEGIDHLTLKERKEGERDAPPVRLGTLLDEIYEGIVAIGESGHPAKTEYFSHGAIGYAAYAQRQPDARTPAQMRELYAIAVRNIAATPQDDLHAMGHYLEAAARICEYHRIDPRANADVLAPAVYRISELIVERTRKGSLTIEESTHALMGAEKMERLLR